MVNLDTLTEDKKLQEAIELLNKHREQRIETFKKELEELMQEYGLGLTAEFILFGVKINPPLRIVDFTNGDYLQN